jgi:hypothetical protein
VHQSARNRLRSDACLTRSKASQGFSILRAALCRPVSSHSQPPHSPPICKAQLGVCRARQREASSGPVNAHMSCGDASLLSLPINPPAPPPRHGQAMRAGHSDRDADEDYRCEARPALPPPRRLLLVTSPGRARAPALHRPK